MDRRLDLSRAYGERLDECLSRREAISWCLGQDPFKGLIDTQRHRLAHGAHVGHRLPEPFRHNGLGGGPGVRGLASEHLIEDTPQAVEVGPAV